MNLQTTYPAGSYLGAEGNEVLIQFRVLSDNAYADSDCLAPTDGAFLLDDLSITLDNGTGYAHDFEDGTLGALVPAAGGVGDFAKIWSGLQTLDSCLSSNSSPMIAFIDDGQVVPGTGGSPCINSCYGPGGYIVNTTGGLLGPEAHLHNAIESPVMPWPGPQYAGALLQADIWRDMELDIDSAGMAITWCLRSTTDPDPAQIADEPWVNRNLVQFGGPDWWRMSEPVGELIPAATRYVQIQLTVHEAGASFNADSDDGTPAPYFDNVRLVAFPFDGPAISARVLNLAHDTFPESGDLDLVHLAGNNIRFDTGLAVDDPQAGIITPGDSITITVQPMREGAALVGAPRLHWKLKRNPLFDPFRSSGLPDVGSVEGWEVYDNWSLPLPDGFAFDLPDSGFLFPGDQIHYFFEATDAVGGVALTSTLPADTTGFSNFLDPMAYQPDFKLHALPSLAETEPGVIGQPGILFWDDSGHDGNRDEWYTSFRNLGLVAGRDYDIYETSYPRRGVGQGLGARSTAAQLAGYDDMLYTSGAAETATLGSVHPNGDPSPDVQVLTAWLEQGGKDLFLCGDDLAGDLDRRDNTTRGFLAGHVPLRDGPLLPGPGQHDHQSEAVRRCRLPDHRPEAGRIRRPLRQRRSLPLQPLHGYQVEPAPGGEPESGDLRLARLPGAGPSGRAPAGRPRRSALGWTRARGAPHGRRHLLLSPA